MYALEVKNLNKLIKNEGRGVFQIKDINFVLEKGYIMGLIGPNGSGKTTLIKLIMNLIKKDSGSIKILGMDNDLTEGDFRDRIGFVYDDQVFYEDMNMRKMTDFISTFYSRWNQEKYENYMKIFGLNDMQEIGTLSKGMKIQYSLALALSHEAELIIMDEPTDGLDPIFRRNLLDILQEVVYEEEVSIFYSTHITTDLDKVADYISFIDEGKLIFSDSKETIYDSYKLVRGSREDLTEDLENYCIGLKRNPLGFEALIASENLDKIDQSNLLMERPILEDIMYFNKIDS